MYLINVTVKKIPSYPSIPTLQSIPISLKVIIRYNIQLIRLGM